MNISKDMQKAVIANQQMRQLLLSSAIRQRKNLGTFNGSLGGTTRIKLFNVGVITSLQIFVDASYSTTVAEGVLSHRAPYNLISRIRLTDYDGTDRLNLSGFQLFVLNCVRNRIPYGYNNEGPIVENATEAAGLGNTIFGGVIPFASAAVNKFKFPETGKAINAATTNRARFILDVPLAYDAESDLRGAILGQTAVGEMYLTIDWISSMLTAGSADALFSGGATASVLAANSPSVTCWQEYMLPQSIGGEYPPLPYTDLQTVYELQGNLRTSDNLAAASEKLINYPNVRSVIGAYVNYINGTDAQSKVDGISQFRLIANGNNILRDDTLLSQQVRQRNYVEGDIAFNTYFFMHRNKPIETMYFGNVQLGVTPSVVNANAAMEVMFESFYTKGSALPGMLQG